MFEQDKTGDRSATTIFASLRIVSVTERWLFLECNRTMANARTHLKPRDGDERLRHINISMAALVYYRNFRRSVTFEQ